MTTLDTTAEKLAQAAQDLEPFQDLNLLGVKVKVAEALGLIGRGGVFHEYTLHDISHVTKMLESLDWLIPEATQEVMTPADWLLLVLAIYFHDLGMLVTDAEFDARQNSDFSDFCANELFAGDAGTDYESKVAELGGDQERFLYQEYVRFHHAARISDWILGKNSPSRGWAPETTRAVSLMLDSLPQTFKSDLALVCMSHHLDDLYDTERYRPSRPYGDSEEATANVQYAALLLRTADLLHITHDRTPSIMYRMINPQDPVSQREWAKQAAVERVRAQMGKDAEGRFSESAPKDTIEVFATYTETDPFFGLTSYLTYASTQLEQVAEWAHATSLKYGSEYQFPWRAIDTSEIRTDGYSPRQLSFSLDQAKILDLLTGHTLYNDTSVVLREVMQNALDATRLQAHMDGEHAVPGEVTVEWDSDRREIAVWDNGTGMTEGIIERNLLKAGSSRYQEEEFRKRFPAFSPISRFGIGVLSTFMIADSVQITTCSEHEDRVRQLALRSVHGRYLVRLLDKRSDDVTRRLHPHGTEVRLRLRKSAELPDIADTLQRWIVIPRCSVRAIVDGEEVSDIGFRSPGAALEASLSELGMHLCESDSRPGDRDVRVIEKLEDQVRTAFAVKWSRYFQQWEFLRSDQLPATASNSHVVGTCVEGVRVEESSPGFAENGVVALVDARGTNAPKTNVARVGLEATPERRTMLRKVYGAYLSHVRDECEALQIHRKQSLTWAAQESETQLEILLSRDPYSYQSEAARPIDRSTLHLAVRAEPLVLIEEAGSRQLVAADELASKSRLWTVDSGLVRAAERILREIPAQGSLHAIASGFSEEVFALPDGLTLVGYRPDSMLYEQALRDREVSEIAILPDQRRVDLAWDGPTDRQLWLALRSDSQEFRALFHTPTKSVFVGRSGVPLQGGSNEVAVRAHGSFYLLSGTELADWIIEKADSIDDRSTRNLFEAVAVAAVDRFFSRSTKPEDMNAFVENLGEGRIFRQLESSALGVTVPEELAAVLERTPLHSFDTWAWHRNLNQMFQ